MRDWTSTVTNNLKLVAASAIGALIAGGGAAATTMSLVSDETATETAVTSTAIEGALLTVSTSDTPTVGITPKVRPTDTHGYCISTAVHAAKAAGGDAAAVKAAKAAGKQACTDAKNAAKAKAKADKAAKKPAKADKPAKPAKAAKGVQDKPAKGKRP